MKTNKKADMAWLYKDVGEKVRAARKDHAELTQKQLGALIGLNRTSIAKIEAGDQRFALDTLYSMSLALGVPLSTLLPNERKRRKPVTDEKNILQAAASPEGLHTKEMESILKAIAEARSNE